MMGIPLDGPAHFRVDNMSVVHNTTNPGSMLKKKSNAISYHYVREGLASGIGRVGYEESSSNQADMLTKVQMGTERQRIASRVLFKRFPASHLIRPVVPPATLEKAS
jgi:hypothetical protein